MNDQGQQPPAPKPRRQRLRFTQRLHDSREFQRVYAAQEAMHAPNLVVFFCPNGLKRSRLGVSVSSAKHGNAVKRNRLKRVLRAAFRQCQHVLPAGYDYVLIPRRMPGEYRTADVCAALIKLAKRIPPADARPPAQGEATSGLVNNVISTGRKGVASVVKRRRGNSGRPGTR